MRKDLRIGLGIGGVLLAVLIVALIVRSNNNKTVAQGTTPDPAADTGNPDGGTGTQPPPDGGTPPVAPPVDPSTPGGSGAAPGGSAADPPAPRPSSDPFAPPAAGEHPPTAGGTGGNSAWDAVFSEGGGGVSRTQTPTGGSSSSASPGARRASPFPPSLSARDGNGGGSTFLDPGTPAAPGGAAGTGATGTQRIPPATAGQRTHVVQKGENFSSISRAAYGDARHFALIVKANPTLNPQTLRPGTTIIIPDLPARARSTGGGRVGNGNSSAVIDPRTQYRVEEGDTLHFISKKLYGNIGRVNALYELNRQTIGADPGRVKPNMVLRLPEPPTAVASGR